MNITPGPYHLSGNAVVSDDEVVAQFHDGPHRDANMQAVAALPELIAALRDILAGYTGNVRADHLAAARAALRRAGV